MLNSSGDQIGSPAKETSQRLVVGCALLILVLSVCATAGVLSWRVTDRLPRRIDLVFAGLPAVGGGCPNPTFLYDGEGTGYYTIGQGVKYEGPAPLYSVPTILLGEPKTNSGGCLLYPDHVSAEVLSSANTVFPMFIEATFTPGEGFRLGESGKINASVSLLEHFAGETLPLIIARDAKVPVSVNLITTAFDFSPPNVEEARLEIGFTSPISKEWVVSPKADAIGRQQLVIQVLAGDQEFRYDIRTEVRNFLGIDPTTYFVGKLHRRCCSDSSSYPWSTTYGNSCGPGQT